MSAFFGKLFTLLLSKLQKVRYLHCVVKFQLRKLGCALAWSGNAIPQLRKCVALQLNQKVHCESCTALQKLKKINCAFCAVLLLVEKIVRLRCAALLVQCYLCPHLEISHSLISGLPNVTPRSVKKLDAETLLKQLVSFLKICLFSLPPQDPILKSLLNLDVFQSDAQ